MSDRIFTLNFVDPAKSTINLSPTAVNGPSGFARLTDLDILGMGSTLWGESILGNMIHLLENFACSEDVHAITKAFVPTNTFSFLGDVCKSFPVGDGFEVVGSDTNSGMWTVKSSSFDQLTNTTIVVPVETIRVSTILGQAGHQGWPHRSLKFSPVKPVEGQLWYNKTRGQVFVYVTTRNSPGYWKRLGNLTVSSSQPITASEGDLWWDTTSYQTSSAEFGRNLNVFVAGSWVRAIADYLPRDGSKAMTGTLDMGANFIVNVKAPTAPTDALNLASADERYVNVSGDAMVGNLDMGTNKVVNVGAPEHVADVLPLGFADDRYVNVTGDTLTGTLTITSPLAIETTGDVKVGSIQSVDLIVENSTSSSSIHFVDQNKNTKTIQWNNAEEAFTVENADGTAGKVWNSANQGHNSTLDADTLDTHHASDFALKTYVDSVSVTANAALTLEQLYNLTYPPTLSASTTSTYMLLDQRRSSVGVGGQNQTVLAVKSKTTGTVRVKIAKRSVYSNGGVGIGFLVDGIWVYGGWNVNNTENTDWQYYDLGTYNVSVGTQLQVFVYDEFTGGADVGLQLFIDTAPWPANYSDVSHWFDVVT